MKRSIFAALALVMAIGLQPQAARAQDATASWNALVGWLSHGEDPHLFYGGVAVGIGTGVASYYLTEKHGNPGVRRMSIGGAYGVTTAACAVVTPFIDTALLNRPLTPREMYVALGDCIVPFIGGWFVDRALPHDAWTDGTPPPRVRRHK